MSNQSLSNIYVERPLLVIDAESIKTSLTEIRTGKVLDQIDNEKGIVCRHWYVSLPIVYVITNKLNAIASIDYGEIYSINEDKQCDIIDGTNEYCYLFCYHSLLVGGEEFTAYVLTLNTVRLIGTYPGRRPGEYMMRKLKTINEWTYILVPCAVHRISHDKYERLSVFSVVENSFMLTDIGCNTYLIGRDLRGFAILGNYLMRKLDVDRLIETRGTCNLMDYCSNIHELKQCSFFCGKEICISNDMVYTRYYNISMNTCRSNSEYIRKIFHLDDGFYICYNAWNTSGDIRHDISDIQPYDIICLLADPDKERSPITNIGIIMPMIGNEVERRKSLIIQEIECVCLVKDVIGIIVDYCMWLK